VSFVCHVVLPFNVRPFTLTPGLALPHSRRRKRLVVYDLFPVDSLLRQLHKWEGIPRFLSAVLRQPVYGCADPLLSLAATIMGDGEQHGWHFDETTTWS
jgi:hypothetical protein